MAASKKLSTYQAKRDFTQTGEPSGETSIVATDRRRFVIQKHAATRLHYDLRLELDGVFKSWAVTRGPSLDPADKRLAVEVEDHPLDYGDFEGTIPKGQYGGGTVQLWDRGYWEPEGDRTPEEAFASGDLKFVLDGERLHGGWVLVRMKWDRSGGKRTNWLLIKHRDEFAQDGKGEAILAEDRSIASGRPMAKIAAGKGRGPKPFMLPAKNAPDAVWDSNKGVATEARRQARSTSQSVKGAPRASQERSEPLPDFIAPQLCQSVPRPPTGTGWLHEIKFDGYRVQLRVQNGKVSLKTRKGLDWTAKFRVIAEEAASLPDTMLDGEVIALDENGAPNFAALQAALSEQDTANLVFYAFDLLFEGEHDLRRCRWSNGSNGCGSCSPPGKHGKPRASASWSISRRAATPYCVRRAGSRSRASSQSERMRLTAPAGRTAGQRQNAAPVTKWSSAAGARQAVTSARYWSGYIGPSISSMSAGSVPVSANRRSSNCCPG